MPRCPFPRQWGLGPTRGAYARRSSRRWVPATSAPSASAQRLCGEASVPLQFRYSAGLLGLMAVIDQQAELFTGSADRHLVVLAQIAIDEHA